jgi:hypothetical protein
VINGTGYEKSRRKWRLNGIQKTNFRFKDMWPDDPLWSPRVLQGEKLQAEFVFGINGNIEEYKINKLE